MHTWGKHVLTAPPLSIQTHKSQSKQAMHPILTDVLLGWRSSTLRTPQLLKIKIINNNTISGPYYSLYLCAQASSATEALMGAGHCRLPQAQHSGGPALRALCSPVPIGGGGGRWGPSVLHGAQQQIDDASGGECGWSISRPEGLTQHFSESSYKKDHFRVRAAPSTHPRQTPG